MKKINKSKVIIPALAMIALTTAASATGTVAWFTANQTVTATGLKATVTAGDNLFIAENKSGFNANTVYQTGLEYNNDSAALAPVSTVDGVNYFKANSVNANGRSATGYTAVTSNVPDTNKVGYIEYDVYLKGTNDGSTDKAVTLNTLELEYQNSTADISGIKAFRVAVLATDNNGTPWTAQTTTNATLQTIYAPSDAANFESGKAVGLVEDNPALKAVAYNETGKTVGSIAAGATEYFRVQVRLYVEGEDSTCLNSVFANKSANWNFNIGFAIKNSDSYAQVSALTISKATA